MSKITLTDLARAVQNPDGKQRRAEIRKLHSTAVGPHLKNINWKQVGKNSPFVGEGPDQYNLRPTWSEYRDRCSPKVQAYMIHIISFDIDIDIDTLVREFVQAIQYPEEHGYSLNNTSSGVKAYEFGRHKSWDATDAVWNFLHQFALPSDQQPQPQQNPQPQPQPSKDSTPMPDTWTISTEKKDRDLIDSVLKQVTNNEVSVERIESAINGGLQAQKQVKILEDKLKRQPKSVSAPINMPAGLPNLTGVTWRNANDVFRPNSRKVKALDFEIPVFDWESPHPDVPFVDDSYVFRNDLLVPVLLSLVDNKKAWLSGHTGTGKSTLVKQVAAQLNWPVLTISLDGEISRMDLIGRDSLTTDQNGKTISKFIDGVLPRAFSQPCILLCDEIDFVRDDIAYTLQTALNENEVTITEDGGRVVRATQWSRIIATANTLGQGDDSGLYRGAKVQSQAFLDRFTTWITVPYMAQSDEKQLIENNSPQLEPLIIEQMLNYAQEHREGFVNATILQPLSPRGMLALADKYLRYYPLFSNPASALKQAIDETLLNRSNAEDRIVLEGIVNRVFDLKS